MTFISLISILKSYIENITEKGRAHTKITIKCKKNNKSKPKTKNQLDRINAS